MFYFYLPNRVELPVCPRDLKGALTLGKTTFFLTGDTWHESSSSFKEAWLGVTEEEATYTTLEVNNWYDIMSEVRTKWPEVRVEGK